MFNKMFGKKNSGKTEEVSSIKMAEEVRTDVIGAQKTSEATIVEIQPSETGKETVDVVIKPTEAIAEAQPKVENPPEPPPLTDKDLKYLKRSRYEKTIANNDRFKKTYLLHNIRTGQIVELRAASSCHACGIIGWKPNQVRVMAEKEIQPSSEKTPETASGSKEIKRQSDPETGSSLGSK